ncbi:MAG: hypothetical protein GX294_05135, partial [Candidatus Cloacimonetes bacterium]|nr:hypothetical protein [Candidatus Cloacimonadota bacterium]
FGVAVEYENPFFGTGFPLWLLAVDGMFYDDNVTARLVIFELNEAGTTWEGIVGGYVTFPTGQQFHAFDLEEHDVLINSQYFMVGYLDIPADNYFLFDKTFNYNTSYAYLDGILYYQPGCWSIGALITNGMPETLDAPHITIVLDGYPKLLWDPVLAALSYYVYGSNDPYADLEDWTLLDIVSATSPLEYYFQDDDEFQFFLVIATTDDPAKRHGIATRITPHHIIQTPNLTHNLKNSLRKANSTGTLLPLQQHR